MNKVEEDYPMDLISSNFWFELQHKNFERSDFEMHAFIFSCWLLQVHIVRLTETVSYARDFCREIRCW